MTTVYFVRHAEPNYENHDDFTRELTAKGLLDRELVSKYLADKNIYAILSSPYKRAVDTVKHFADIKRISIEIVEDFRERKVGNSWIDNFNDFSRQQWEDFSYKLSDGENLAEVQERNVKALNHVLTKYRDKNIVIGSHGTALSTIINYFDKSFGYNEFMEIKSLMPWIVKLTFCDEAIVSIEKIKVN